MYQKDARLSTLLVDGLRLIKIITFTTIENGPPGDVEEGGDVLTLGVDV